MKYTIDEKNKTIQIESGSIDDILQLIKRIPELKDYKLIPVINTITIREQNTWIERYPWTAPASPYNPPIIYNYPITCLNDKV